MPTMVEGTLEALRAVYADVIQRIGDLGIDAGADDVKPVLEACTKLFEVEGPATEAVGEAQANASALLKTLESRGAMLEADGQKFPAEAYAYAPDAQKPGAWKLRMWADSKGPDVAMLATAAASLASGALAGSRTRIPLLEMAEVKRKIRNAYRGLNVPDAEIPQSVKETETRELLRAYTPLTEAAGDKGRATVIVIKAGFNASKDRFYPQEVLKRDFRIFEGLKMYSDHPSVSEEADRPERSIRDWVATLSEVAVDEHGTITGVAEIVENWMQEKLSGLRDKKMLSEMGVSIDAVGQASRGTIEGIETLVVESLVAGRSVDFVTEPGAGGIVTFYEADRSRDVDLIEVAALRERRPDLIAAIEAAVREQVEQEVKPMDELKAQLAEAERKLAEATGNTEVVTKERDTLQEKLNKAETDGLIATTAATVKEALDAATLPDAAKKRIAESWKDKTSDEGLKEAIAAEVTYIAELTESGKVKGMGKTTPSTDQSKADLRESFKRMNPHMTDAQLDIMVLNR